MNAIVNTTDFNTTILQLPEETESLIKASRKHAESIPTRTPQLRDVAIGSNALRPPLSQLHHCPTRRRQIPCNDRTNRCRRQVATQTPIKCPYPADANHTSNIGRHPQRR